MEEVESELRELEKLQGKEKEELENFLKELIQNGENKRNLQEIYSEVQEFTELNQKVVELTELMQENPEEYREIYRRINSLISKHDELEEDILHKLKELGVPQNQLRILYETDKNLENIDEEVVEKIGDKRTDQAREILNNRPTVYFKASSLQKFVSAVKREQRGNGAEVPGIFGYKRSGNDYVLNSFIELENTNPKYGSFNLNEQVTYVLENYGNEREIIFAHSHPPGDFSHSGTDKDLIRKANNIGVIGVPNQNTVYPVPEALNDRFWANLPSKVIRNGDIITDQSLKEEFPAISKYNNALIKAISRNKEKAWPNFL